MRVFFTFFKLCTLYETRKASHIVPITQNWNHGIHPLMFSRQHHFHKAPTEKFVCVCVCVCVFVCMCVFLALRQPIYCHILMKMAPLLIPLIICYCDIWPEESWKGCQLSCTYYWNINLLLDISQWIKRENCYSSWKLILKRLQYL